MNFGTFIWKHLCSIIFLLSLVESVHSIKCYECYSNITAECASDPGEKLDVAECNEELCATAVVSGITHRGCSSNVQPPVSWDDLREECNEDLCNGNIFPSDRLKCHQCSGAECVTLNNTHIIRPCQFYNKNDYCFTNVIDKKNTVRNCLSQSGTSCGEFCQQCNITGCNTHQSITNHTCISCRYMKGITNSEDIGCIRQEAVNNKNCTLRNQTTCINEVLLGRTGKCYSYHKYDTVIRDCLKPPGPGGMDPAHIVECTGDNCNNKCVEIQCLICDSLEDPKCKNDTSWQAFKPQPCPEGTSSCYACEGLDGRVTRGCGVALGPECYSCLEEDSCNKKFYRSCFKCSSSSDPNCAQWTNPAKVGYEICTNTSDLCVSTVVVGSYTVRGCQNSIVECTQSDPNCKRCNTSMCNSDINPEDRLSCHQCSNNIVCNQAQNNGRHLPCANFRYDDGCYTYANNDNQIVRGCLSDKNSIDCKKFDSDRCLECYGHGCNNISLHQNSKLRCIECDKSDSICSWGHKKDIAVPCQSPIEYYLDHACAVIKHNDSTVTRRCLLKSESCPDDAEFCELCDNDGCNNQHHTEQSCIQCNSSNIYQKSCDDGVEDIMPSLCSTPLQLYETRGCYIIRKGEDVTRGCISDRGVRIFDECQLQNENDLCEYCEGNDCNNRKLKNSTNSVKHSIELIILISFIIFSHQMFY